MKEFFKASGWPLIALVIIVLIILYVLLFKVKYMYLTPNGTIYATTFFKRGKGDEWISEKYAAQIIQAQQQNSSNGPLDIFNTLGL